MLVAIAVSGCSSGGNGAGAGDNLLVTPSSVAPAAANRGTGVAMLKLVITASGTQDNAATWTAIRVKRTGGNDNVSIDNVIVALDNGDGAWGGLAADPPIGSTASWEADNTALVAVTPQTVSGGTPKTYFVVFHIYYGAIAGDSVTAALEGAAAVTTSGAGDGVQMAATASTPTTIALTVPAPGTFLRTGEMGTARGYQTATLLGDGRVLIAGVRGDMNAEVASGELYDPARGVFSPASNEMTTGRKFHTATLLANGNVLVTGGNNGTLANGGTVNSAGLFDLAASAFGPTGNMIARRQDHTATRLLDGRGLVAGGANPAGSLAGAELYDPATGAFSATGTMIAARRYHTATLLADGKVLIAGGYNGAYLATAELFDPVSGSFASAGTMSWARVHHSAILLDNNVVLMAGGNNGGGFLAVAEIYDPGMGLFSNTTGAMHDSREIHTATSLPGGEVLVAGGYAGGDLASVERFDPVSGTFRSGGNLLTGRNYHTATLLPDNTVLVTGGFVHGTSIAGAELYSP